jgi:hypothetical protein
MTNSHQTLLYKIHNRLNLLNSQITIAKQMLGMSTITNSLEIFWTWHLVELEARTKSFQMQF